MENQEKWPNDNKRLCLERIVVNGKALFHILRKDQVAYKCRILEIEDRSEFHICADNVRVDQYPVQPFEE